MPKLNNRPPKYSRIDKYAVVYLHGKKYYLGLYGSPESQSAYARLLAELQANPAFYLPKGETGVTVRELATAYLDYAKETIDVADYKQCRIIVIDFLLKLYGDDTPVDSFKPSCLKLVRQELINALDQRGKPRFCRNTINKYTRRIVSLFEWGVGNDHVSASTWQALKAVKSLPKKTPGTFDHKKREHVPEWVITATLPFLRQT